MESPESEASSKKLEFADREIVVVARQRYFALNGFDADGGYSRRFFYIGWKWLAIPLPNVEMRVRAVRIHDLHHIATGYATSWRGEAEIGAWELAGGCGTFLAAWVLNLYSFAVGLAIAPRLLWRAFVRGRRCSNLYDAGFDERLLEGSVGELRLRLRLPAGDPQAGSRDRAAFAAMTLLALGQALISAAPFLAVAWFVLARL